MIQASGSGSSVLEVLERLASSAQLLKFQLSTIYGKQKELADYRKDVRSLYIIQIKRVMMKCGDWGEIGRRGSPRCIRKKGVSCLVPKCLKAIYPSNGES